jgi:plastocyanin
MMTARELPTMRAPRTTLTLLAATLVLAACGGGDGGDGGDTDTAGGDGVVSIEAGDLYFDPEQASASAGTVEFELVNVGAVEHDLVIEEAGDTEVVYAAAGETATGSIELEAGTYTYYCSIPGHRTTMEGTLEVS